MSLSKLTQTPVQTIRISTSVAEAARLMCRHSVGALVITDDSELTPLGVITDRDLVWMVAEGLDPREACVDQFVRQHLHTVCVTESLGDVTAKMRAHGVRRLPIVDTEGRLLGIVSLDDVLKLLGREMADAAATIDAEVEHERGIGVSSKPGKL
jgi:CBS domain-containing protein